MNIGYLVNKIVLVIIKRRFQRWYNKYKLETYEYKNDTLKQVKDEYFSDSYNTDLQFEYVDGLAYAKKLIDKEIYNIYSLTELMKLIPKNYEYILLGENYRIGFLEGLFVFREIN